MKTNRLKQVVQVIKIVAFVIVVLAFVGFCAGICFWCSSLLLEMKPRGFYDYMRVGYTFVGLVVSGVTGLATLVTMPDIAGWALAKTDK